MLNQAYLPPYREIRFKSLDGLGLQGFFAHCDDSAPTVIFCHGKGSSHKNVTIQGVSAYLFANRFNILLFNFRGHQQSQASRPSFGWHEKNDVLGAVRYLKKRKDVNHDWIGAFGVSMGAAALAFAAAECPDIKACAFEGLYSVWETLAQLPDCLPGDEGHTEKVEALKKKLNIDGEIAPVQYIAKISPRPILFIHGKLDIDVPLAQGLELFQAAGKNKELWMVDDGDHDNCYSNNVKEYSKKVLDFFNRTLR